MDQSKKTTIIEDCSEFSSRVKQNYEKLSSSEKKVAEYLLKNETSCRDLTIYQMAEEIHTSVATITRFCQALGYQGLTELKFNLQQRVVAFVNEDMGIRRGDSMNTIKQKALQFTQNAVQGCILNMSSEDLEQAIDAIGRAEEVTFCAMGSATGVANAGVGLFLTAGIHADYTSDALLLLRRAAMMGPKDVLLAISYDGYAKDVGDAMMIARRQGAFTILITSARDSLLGQYANLKLLTPARSLNNAMSITTTAMCQLAILQSLMVGTVAKYLDELSVRSDAQLHLSDLKRYDRKQSAIEIKKTRQ